MNFFSSKHCALAHSPLFSQIETLVVHGANALFASHVASRHVHFPCLHTLSIRRCVSAARSLQHVQPSKILDHVQILDLGIFHEGADAHPGSALLAINLPEHIHTLDLSHLHIDRAREPDTPCTATIRHVFEALVESNLLAHVQTLRLGRWLECDEAVEVLATLFRLSK